MTAPARVFISATSRDLASFRKAVADVLPGLDALPVSQDTFPPDYRSIREILRDKIGLCAAVICLVGRRYGYEPTDREDDEPRRSYTQLEYEIAEELRKPVFLFVARDECPCDDAEIEPEPDELRALQLEYIRRLVATNRVRMPFRSREHLVEQVRGMRFDAESLEITTRLAVVLTAELVDGGSSRDHLGEMTYARDVLRPYHDLLKEALVRWRGKVQSESPAECQVNFESADAARARPSSCTAPSGSATGPVPPGLRVGIDMGQVIRFGGTDAHTLQSGQPLTVSRHLSGICPHPCIASARPPSRPATSTKHAGATSECSRSMGTSANASRPTIPPRGARWRGL